MFVLMLVEKCLSAIEVMNKESFVDILRRQTAHLTLTIANALDKENNIHIQQE